MLIVDVVWTESVAAITVKTKTNLHAAAGHMMFCLYIHMKLDVDEPICIQPEYNISLGICLICCQQV